METKELKFFKDGDKICCVVEEGFTNIQECTAGFGNTEEEAEKDLLEQLNIEKPELKKEQITRLAKFIYNAMNYIEMPLSSRIWNDETQDKKSLFENVAKQVIEDFEF